MIFDAPRNRIRMLVVVGGAVGTLARAAVGETTQGAGAFPWGTLAVNIAGSIGLGYLLGRSLTVPAESRRLPLLGVGVMGALTTFGGVMVQTLDLVQRGTTSTALLYVATSVGGGLAAALMAIRAGETR